MLAVLPKWKDHYEPVCLYHHGFGVSSQRVLQQACEFRIPVGHVCALPIHQSGDHVPQSGKGQVDLCGLFKTLPSGSCLTLPLGSLTSKKHPLQHFSLIKQQYACF